MIQSDILLVDDDPSTLTLLASILGGLAAIRVASSGLDALRLAQELPPDLILLDEGMPGMSGMDLCAQLKADERLISVPVVFVTGHNSPEQELSALELGAADYIVKPVHAGLLRARVKHQLALKRTTDLLRDGCLTDSLTGIFNRRRFDEDLVREWARAHRALQPLSLLMIDIDHFKRYNDCLGHSAGDQCLRLIAKLLLDCLMRPGDLAARYGGEEFAVLLPATDATGARYLGERILTTLTSLALPHPDSPTARQLTLSIGVATLSPGELTRPAVDDCGGNGSMVHRPVPHHLVDAADKALYRAKRLGRSRVCVENELYSLRLATQANG